MKRTFTRFEFTDCTVFYDGEDKRRRKALFIRDLVSGECFVELHGCMPETVYEADQKIQKVRDLQRKRTNLVQDPDLLRTAVLDPTPDFQDLRVDALRKGATQADINSLGEWCRTHLEPDPDREDYDIEHGHHIRPVFQIVNDESVGVAYWEIDADEKENAEDIYLGPRVWDIAEELQRMDSWDGELLTELCEIAHINTDGCEDCDDLVDKILRVSGIDLYADPDAEEPSHTEWLEGLWEMSIDHDPITDEDEAEDWLREFREQEYAGLPDDLSASELMKFWNEEIRKHGDK